MHENGDFWSGLAGFGTAPALICGDDILTYAQLAAQADAQIADMRAAIPLDITRPLVAIEAEDSFAAIIAYLACLRAGWPVLLMAPDDARIVAMFRPNYRFGQGALASDAAVMHPDLALLLPTSGSTGLPKLVRLSRRNIASNAAAIVDYLQISASDRALMALPWHYSYGMSVLHTHLLAGAALVLSPHRVDNAAFWRLAKGQGITTLALVPTQFDLIEKHDFVHELPKTLRYLTCAGGRLQPARAALFANICPLVLNYGATEASPRMAWLPPENFAAFPDSIGRPIPGGHLALEAGELVFKGPGVMLGYAESREELANPAGPDKLYTGDLAEELPNGYFRITGRKSRFIKPGGIRLGLDEIERFVHENGISAHAIGQGEGLALFSAQAFDAGDLRRLLAQKYHLPEQMLRLERLEKIPLLANGKPDYRALAALAPAQAVNTSDLATVLQAALRRPRLNLEQSFAQAGGDSLAWLEVQMSLANMLGRVPKHWETLPLRDLLALTPQPRQAWQATPPEVILRALALSLIIFNHATEIYTAIGSTWVLMLLAGLTLARFQSGNLFAGRVGTTLRVMLLPVLAAYFAIIGAIHLFWLPVDRGWFLLIGNFGTDLPPQMIAAYWFVCLYAQVIALLALPFLWPWLRQKVAARPFEAGMLVALVFAVLGLLVAPENASIYQLRQPVFCLQVFALGWAAFYARNARDRLLVSLLVVLIFVVFAQQSTTSFALIVAGSLFAIWGRDIALPRALAQALLFVGAAAMFIYLAHVLCVVLVRQGLGQDGLAAFALVLPLSLACGIGARYLWRSALKLPRLLVRKQREV